MDKTPGFVIRPASAGDIPAWLALRAALWPDTGTDTHRREIDAILAETGNVAVPIAADDAGLVIGFVELSIRKAAEGCLTDRIGYVEARRLVHFRKLLR
jgi:aminoglycoside 6'-N-acetyltransferase I